MEDDQRKFIQKYNSNIRHNEDTTNLVIPDGVNIKQKVRRRLEKSDEISDDESVVRTESLVQREEEEEDQDETPKIKKQKVRHRRKKIRFPLIEESNDE